MEKRVAILTLNTAVNYGQRLQNYALSTALQSLGVSAQTIPVVRVQSAGSRWRSFLRFFWQLLKGSGKSYLINRVLEKRSDVFESFNRSYIPTTPFFLSDALNKPNLFLGYDAFFAGSDQVWNPDYYNRFLRLGLLLSFAPPEKRFSYAASIGRECVDFDTTDMVKCLKDFAAISVREESAVLLLNRLGINASVHIDPVFLLTKEQWSDFAEKSKHKIKKGFVLLYCLGKEAKLLKDAKAFAKAHKLNLISLWGGRHTEKGLTGRRYYYDPCDFVYLFQNAKAVFTDSFHGSAFALIFHKPLAAYCNNRKASYRLIDLARILSARPFLVDEGGDSAAPLPQDNSLIDAAIDLERQKGLAYLKNCIDNFSESGSDR